jgi:hypothetical protein
MKGVHPLYQLQVVVNNNDIRVAPTRLRKWVTQSSMTVIPIMQRPLFFFMCSHFKAFYKVLIKSLKPFSQDQNARNSSLPSNSSKTTKNLKNQNHHYKTSQVQSF